jgi:DNA-binding transcriptional LysR family regulator
LYRKLSDRNLDVLVTRKFGPIGEHLEFESLFDDSPLLVVAGAKSPWARRRRIELAELVNERWALPSPDSGMGSLVMEAFHASGLAYPRTTAVADFVEGRMNLLASGRFLTILPPAVLGFSTGRPRCKVLPVELPSARVSVGIVTLKNRTLSPVARLFIEHARGREAAGEEEGIAPTSGCGP